MSNQFGRDLPAGVTNREIEMSEMMGEEACETCGGGSVEECESGEVCPKCKGSGIIAYSVAARRAEQREAAMEAKWEQERDDRL